MIVWEDGKMKKSDYRKFIIQLRDETVKMLHPTTTYHHLASMF